MKASFFLFLSFCSLILNGQTDILDTVLVSSSNIPMSLQQTGRNITVISKQELSLIPANSLDEILQTVTGVEIQSRNGFGAQADISMRGSTFTQVLVLIDGMRLNDPLTAHFNANIPVSKAEIESIEILRGPAAAMYGPDAVGGVINVKTKTFAVSKKEEKSISGELMFGDRQLVRSSQGFSHSKGSLKVGGGLNITRSIGQVIEEKLVDENTTLESYSNFFDIKTAGLSFSKSFKKGFQASARLAYDRRDFSARYFYTSSTFDKSVETTQNYWSHFQLAKVGKNAMTDFNVAYKYNTDIFIFSPDFPSTNNHVTDFLNFALNHDLRLNENWRLKGGLQIDQRSIESNDRGNHSDLHYGAYATGHFSPKEAISLTASLRADYDDNYDLEFSPQLNFAYLLNKINLRASIGRSIRAADYTERYVSNNLVDLSPGRSLGNPFLMAERSWSEEIGLDVQAAENLLIKATLFFRQSAELIDYVQSNESTIQGIGSLQEGADYFFAQNISDVDTKGFEVEASYSKSLNQETSLSAVLGYTYLDTRNDEDEVSVYISSHAKHLGTARLLLDHKHFNIGITGLYKDRSLRQAAGIGAELAPSYFLVNANVGLKISERLRISLQMNNVGDISYQNILGAEMPRRWFMGGLKFEY